jgi:tyrosyl-tRNA synthetase
LYKKEAECFTFPLISSSSGEKMGKTSNNALWLAKDKTSAYDYYQYWINVEDSNIINLLMRYTSLPYEKIMDYSKLQGRDINIAKELLAFEATKIVHGSIEAELAKQKSKKLFSSDNNLDDLSGIDYVFTNASVFLSDLIYELKLLSSKAEAKRLIQGGGVYINNTKIENISYTLNKKELASYFILKIGKKKKYKINII